MSENLTPEHESYLRTELAKPTAVSLNAFGARALLAEIDRLRAEHEATRKLMVEAAKDYKAKCDELDRWREWFNLTNEHARCMCDLCKAARQAAALAAKEG